MSDDKIKVLTRNDLAKKILKENPEYSDVVEIHPPSNELMQIPFSSIKPKPIQWLWEKRIARGMITIFAGDPGKGKSQLLLWIAAQCSLGGKMPVDGAIFPQGKVALLSAEDCEDVTMSPRLHALNANQDAILQLKSSSSVDQATGELMDDMVRLDRDIARLDNTFANNPGYVCLIIDPISAYIGSTNDYKNTEVRVLLTKLSNVAKKHNIAVILNTHLTKPGSGGGYASAMSRVMGSGAYVAVARSAYLILDNEDDRKIKQFIPMKNNVGDDLIGFEYRIKSAVVEHDIMTSHIEWLPNSIQKDANEAINPQTKTRLNKTDEAMEFIRNCLKNGTMIMNDVRRKAAEAGISGYCFYAAKDKLKVIEDYTTERPRLITWTLSDKS